MADPEQKDGPKRDRSPAFPYIGLAKALQRIEILFGKVKRHEARVADIAADWKLSPKSSSTDRTVAALESFGLIDSLGSGDAKKIKISDVGLRILDDGRPGVREKLLAEAAMRPRIISEYAERWKGGRPDETHALSQLKFEGGFTDEGAKMFLRVFDETIRFTLGSQSDSAFESDRDEIHEDGEDAADNQEKERSTVDRERSKRREAKPGMKEDVFSLHEGDVILQWPETLSAESYQDLEDWTKLLLRKIKRAIEAVPQKDDTDEQS